VLALVLSRRAPVLLGAALLAAWVSACHRKKPTPTEPIRLPSVALPVGDAVPIGLIVITTDTLRADYLSCYGHTRILTPSIDRLASGGQLFRNAIAQSTTTTPSHASLFSSLYLQDHNVFSNFEALGEEPRTLAEVLYGRGFATFAIANMRHLNPEVANLDQGVETYVPSGNMRRAAPTIDQFLRWVDRLGERPFFAWIHIADVHTPYRPPPPYDRFYYDDDERDPTRKSLSQIWPLLPTHMSDHPFFQQWLEGITDVEWVYAQYQGAVTYTDDEVGRLLDALEDRDLLHRTAIVFTADHGESLGEHAMYFVHTGLYEPTVHVPLVTYFPGAGRQGVQIKEVVELVDVMPTILDYFDIPAPRHIRGRSLWPLIRGEITPPRVAFIEHAGKSLVALRSDRYKYIRHLRTLHIQPGYPFYEGKEELYDLRADPGEQRDLAPTERDLLSVFRRELKSRRSERMGLSTAKAELTAETVEVLKSLGYVR
jgi:arylsulfatase A-like enzyme